MKRAPGLAALLGLALGAHPVAGAFEVNGRHWDELPVGYYLNPEGCPVLPSGEDLGALVAAAAANWEAPVCTRVRLQYLGETRATWAADGQNTIFCVPEDWGFTAGAAGASLWIPTPPGQPLEVDLALNTADFTWRLGGGDAFESSLLDPVAVLTHELGHWLGLSHSPDPYASMYFASLPLGLGATLAGDDVAGICSLYPSGQRECQTEADCPPGYSCRDIQGIPVCQEPHDPPGAFCSRNFLNCDGMCWVSFFECSQVCLFTRADYTQGYCAPLCPDGTCPEGFHCRHIVQPEVDVCELDPAADGGSDGQDGDPDGNDGGEEDGAVEDGSGEDGDGPEAGEESPDAAGDALDGAWEEGPDGEDAGADDPPPEDAGLDAGDDLAAEGGGCGCSSSRPGGAWWPLVGLLCMLGLRRAPPRVHGARQ